MSAAVRIVLADDQALVRAGLAMVLGSEDGFTVVAQCEDGAGVLPAVRAHRPDLVLVDVRMPRVDGPEAIRRLRSEPGAPPVLTLTTFDDDEVLWAALDAGAAGFVLKDSPAEVLVDAVRAVAAGGAWLDPRVLPRVLDRARRRPAPAAGTAVLDRLTPREADVLRLVCRGASNAEIAGALRLGERTVKSHVSAILAKLGVRDRAAAIVAAYDAGLGR
ncbi:two component transcriptional regulator, LuxR family [Geodermatophilus dictyosporus]|uniref:Two component transcriptional regulator, LuxR family n=1 Tax=Geodermatophilus dictyosporus TaxID=1523247 RepID=A0A1I5SIC2_9ACTN|nr:response regulator transcription factor [Geodermatophilus dictyosporus]SFP70524.1 two component transcriptional regulator, LuxR family [Geodermatophilus dictyosporus]